MEENLRQLGRDYLDVVNLRRQGSQDSIGPHFAALAELREAGLIRHPGVSDVTVEQLDEALTIVPGTGSSVHLEENVAAASLCLDAEDLARLDAAS